MIGKDIEGNEYELRALTDKEKAKLKERLDDCRGSQLHMLILECGEGIAIPSGRANSAKYYGGLCYDHGEEEIIVDGERYMMWEYYNMETATDDKNGWEDWYRGFDFKDTNVFHNYLGPLDDKWWEGDE
tara:strand:+ start:308 stop:694 length:387 start_codon:yes stop_codon:yes gene_type:complete